MYTKLPTRLLLETGRAKSRFPPLARRLERKYLLKGL